MIQKQIFKGWQKPKFSCFSINLKKKSTPKETQKTFIQPNLNVSSPSSLFLAQSLNEKSSSEFLLLQNTMWLDWGIC